MKFDPKIVHNGMPEPPDEPEGSCDNPECPEYGNRSLNIETTKYTYTAWCDSCDYTEFYEPDYADLISAKEERWYRDYEY